MELLTIKYVLNVITHKHYKFISFNCVAFIINEKKNLLVLNIRYNLLNLKPRVFQICSYSFTEFQDYIHIKLLLQ